MITVTAQDANGNLIQGATVVLSATGGGNTLTQPVATTDVNGIATGSLATTVAETKTVSATIDGTAVTQTVDVIATSGGVSSSQSTVSAAPSTIEASSGASSSTITVTALDANGNPIEGVTVVLSATGAGNTINQSGITDANGIATGTLSSTAAGVKTVSATIDGILIVQTADVTVQPAAVSETQSTIEADPTTLAADGSTSTITVTALDAFGNPISGLNVVLSATGTGNTITQPASVTDTIGIATGSLSSTEIGVKTVSATINGTPVTQTVDITVSAGAVSAGQSSVSAAPATISADGETTDITVTVRDGNGNPVSGVTVTLSATGSGNTIVQPGDTTGADGVATGTLSSTAAGVKTVSADAGGTTITETADVTVTSGAISATVSTVEAVPDTIAAGGPTSTITVTALDANGNPIPGETVVLAATGTGNTLTQPLGVTDASGVATGTLSSTVMEVKTVSATVNGTTVIQTVDVTVVPGGVSASLSTVVAAPTSITTDGETSTITVTALDDNSNPIEGATVVLSATGSGNTVTQPVGTTNASGVVTGTLSSTVAEAKTVSATVNFTPITQTAAVTVTAGAVSATQSSVSASPTTITASDGSSASTIMVTARDANDNPIEGATVVLAATGSQLTLTLTQPVGLTDAAGVATGTLSSTEAGTRTVSATINGTPATQTADVAVTAGGVSADLSTVAVSPASINADGQTSTVTVTARDANNNPIQGATVILAATGTGNTITQPAGTTNGSGVATGTISSTVAEDKAVSATIDGTAVTQTAVVSVTAGAAANIAISSGDNLTGPVNSTLGTPHEVLVTDANGNPRSGATVTWSVGGGGSVNPLASASNDSGFARTTRTLGPTAGTQTTNAVAPGLTGSPLTFTITATAGGASAMNLVSGDNQTGPVDTLL
jgi:adhesin/invasin